MQNIVRSFYWNAALAGAECCVLQVDLREDSGQVRESPIIGTVEISLNESFWKQRSSSVDQILRLQTPAGEVRPCSSNHCLRRMIYGLNRHV